MEKYINDDTVVQDEIFKALKDSVICPICHCILINPMMCMGCQNVFCKKCADEWAEKEDRCPGRCKNQNYQKCIGKTDIILSKLKFKCSVCGEKVAYDNIKSHMEICDKDYMENLKKNEEKENEKEKENNNKKIRIQAIKKEDVSKYSHGEKIPHITCKLK